MALFLVHEKPAITSMKFEFALHASMQAHFFLKDSSSIAKFEAIFYSCMDRYKEIRTFVDGSSLKDLSSLGTTSAVCKSSLRISWIISAAWFVRPQSSVRWTFEWINRDVLKIDLEGGAVLKADANWNPRSDFHQIAGDRVAFGQEERRRRSKMLTNPLSSLILLPSEL